MTPRISVIIPVYNVERYLPKCIDSVLAQRGCEFEVLLVNDGSSDGSLDVCRSYEAKDSRVRVFDKPNGGVSSARNMGLDNAVGEWIFFLDADDWLSEDAFEVLAPYMDDNDVIRFALMDIFADDHTKPRRLRPAADRNEAFSQVIGHRTIIGVGGSAYRRSLIEEWSVRFDTKLTYGEDWLVLSTLLFHSRRVKTLHDAYLYVYNRYNEASCSNRMTAAKLVQSLMVARRLREMVGEGNYTAELRHTRCCRVNMLIKHCGYQQTTRELMASREDIDMLSLGDILLAKAHLSMRVRLLRLWFGYLRYALAKES